MKMPASQGSLLMKSYLIALGGIMVAIFIPFSFLRTLAFVFVALWIFPYEVITKPGPDIE